MQANAVVGPHAVMVHQHHALVAHTAMMCAQRLDKVAFLAENAFIFRHVSLFSQL